MKYVPFFSALGVALLIAVALGASPLGIVGFVLVSLAAGFLAILMKAGSEVLYWAALGTTLLMIGLSYFGFDVNGFVFILPTIFALSYFAARLSRAALRPKL